MRLSDVIKFQKALALAASASNEFEAKAAEQAVRRLVEACNLDPTRIPDASFVSHANFADNALLKKLRDEYRAAHPHKTSKKGITRRLRRNPKPASASPVNSKATSKREPAFTIPFSIDGFRKSVLHNIVVEAARTMRAQGARDGEIVAVLRFVASEIETHYRSDNAE